MAKSRLTNLEQKETKKNWKKMMIINDKIVWRGWTYDPQYPKKLIQYFAQYKPYNEEKNNVTGKTDKVANDYPTFEWFRAEHQIPPSTRENWMKNYPELKEAVEMARDIKKNFLIQNWLHWTYNAQMARFIGMNDLGMSEKKEVNNTGSISDDQIKKLAFEYLNDIKDWWEANVLEVSEDDDKTAE